MADLIERYKAITAIYHNVPNISMEMARYILHEVLSAQPEQKDGKWIRDEYGYLHCSECRMEWEETGHPATNFCPNCGAKMEGIE